MRNLNGDNFTVSMVVDFEFTLAEGDRFLAARSEDRQRILDELLSHKNPLGDFDVTTYNAGKFAAALGQVLVAKRERELKQLPERAEGATLEVT